MGMYSRPRMSTAKAKTLRHENQHDFVPVLAFFFVLGWENSDLPAFWLSWQFGLYAVEGVATLQACRGERNEASAFATQGGQGREEPIQAIMNVLRSCKRLP